MTNIIAIKNLLQQSITIPKERHSAFFKTGAGHYAEHDQFIGVKVPALRIIAKSYNNLSLSGVEILLNSPINEERLLALFILVGQYQKAKDNLKDELYQFYLNNLKQVNNWNLVDASAHLIIGAHLLKRDKVILFSLAQSELMWERRIAIVSTWYFIRHNDLKDTFKLAEILLNDRHDLIHKAVGWMLREAGKKDQSKLIAFLEQHAHKMPRTMLRYSIEKFQENQRQLYLFQGK
jgi:3-methyladenine DNA glycosylase AlkD